MTRKRKPKAERPMEFYATDACCAACKELHGFWPPMICRHNNLSQRDVWRDPVTLSWTIDSPVTSPAPDTFERLGDVVGRVLENVAADMEQEP